LKEKLAQLASWTGNSGEIKGFTGQNVEPSNIAIFNQPKRDLTTKERDSTFN
jgi:hypothetical protein